MRSAQAPTGLSWMSFSHGDVPKHAVRGGEKDTGQPFYIGRAGHKGDLVCGKIDRENKCLYIPSGREEHKYSHYEVLCHDDADVELCWIPASGGHIPLGAVPGGYSEDTHENFYVGRTLTKHKGDIVPGKVHPKYGLLYYPSGNCEHEAARYEVLVVDEPDSYEIYDVQYDLRNVKDKHEDITIETMVATNEGTTEQEATLTKNCAQTSSQNWGNQVGVKVGVKTSFKAGFPCLAEGKVEVSVEGSYTHSWGSSQSQTKSTSVSVKVKIPPRSQISADVVAKKTTLDVPYKSTVSVIKADRVTKTFPTTGVFKGVECHSFEVKVRKAKPLPEK